MAKNDQLPSVTHTYLRKDTQFFADGVWWISTPCPVHGLVDESVTWEEAKTPHHAGLIADQRHTACNVVNEAHALYLAGLDEIAAAEGMRDQQKENLKAAAEQFYDVKMRYEADLASRVLQAELAHATRNLRRHEHAMKEAERRVSETIEANAR